MKTPFLSDSRRVRGFEWVDVTVFPDARESIKGSWARVVRALIKACLQLPVPFNSIDHCQNNSAKNLTITLPIILNTEIPYMRSAEKIPAGFCIPFNPNIKVQNRPMYIRTIYSTPNVSRRLSLDTCILVVLLHYVVVIDLYGYVNDSDP